MNNKFQFDDVDDTTRESKDEDIEILTMPEESSVENIVKEEKSVENNVKEETVVENIPKPEVKEKTNIDITKKFYFSFEARIAVSVFVILLLFAGACFLGLRVINHTTLRSVKYIENGDLYYQTSFKCTTDCVSDEYTYDTSEVKNIKITFDYDAKFNEKIKYNNYYKITATISKYSKEDHSLLKQNDIDLVSKKLLSSENEKYPITEVVNINYPKYKSEYATSSNEDVQLDVIFYLTQDDETRKISGLVIPLTKDSFELRKYTTINTIREATEKVNTWDTYSLVYGIVASFLTLVSLVLIYKTTRLVLKVTNNKSEYDAAVETLLKEHESIITVYGEGYDSIVPEEKQVVKFDSFDELVKVQERINKPIVYSKINNVKCEFVLEDDKSLYKYVMKEVDFTEEDKNKLENK